MAALSGSPLISRRPKYLISKSGRRRTYRSWVTNRAFKELSGVLAGVSTFRMDQERTPPGFCPEITHTSDWVRLPQRFPVRIEPAGTPPVALRIGQTVSVSMSQETEHA